MSLDLESELKRVLASAPRDVRPIQTIQLSHSAMTQTYYLWREPYTGTITANGGSRTVQPVNMRIDLAGSEGHLDQTFRVSIDTTDVEDELREQLDLIPLGTTEEIVCVYREYLSNDLTTVVASATLEVEEISFQRGVATFIAVSPRLNKLRTGEIYAPREIPMLRGFL